MLNDPVFVEAARAFAECLLAESGLDDKSRISRAFRLALSRKPTSQETKVLGKLLEMHRKR